MFECWWGDTALLPEEVIISTYVEDERKIYKRIEAICKDVLNKSLEEDPTRGCDHYNNPEKEGFKDWTENCVLIEIVGDHFFYKSIEDPEKLKDITAYTRLVFLTTRYQKEDFRKAYPWTIKNRAAKYDQSIYEVCENISSSFKKMKLNDYIKEDQKLYKKIEKYCYDIMTGYETKDPTNGCCNYLNSKDIRCRNTLPGEVQIDKFTFYKGPVVKLEEPSTPWWQFW